MELQNSRVVLAKAWSHDHRRLSFQSLPQAADPFRITMGPPNSQTKSTLDGCCDEPTLRPVLARRPLCDCHLRADVLTKQFHHQEGSDMGKSPSTKNMRYSFRLRFRAIGRINAAKKKKIKIHVNGML